MKCKACKRIIENDSLYCRFCGERLFTTNREVKVPRPRLLRNGRYGAQVARQGKREWIDAATEDEYLLLARQYKIYGNKKGEKAKPVTTPTLTEVIERHIETNENVLSPSSLRSYNCIVRTRFKAYMKTPIDKIDYQKMVNDEANLCSPKTLKTSFGLVKTSCNAVGYTVPKVNLPKVPPPDTGWLDYEQIQIFLKAIRGTDVELGALLMLHSLRVSEALALTRNSIKDNCIHVVGAVVPNEFSQYVKKKTNKTAASRRVIPIMIPRLLELLPASGNLITMHPATLQRHINKICEENDLPVVGCHGLRRSFASLAYHLGMSERTLMQVGGWTDIETIHKAYIKMSQKDVSSDIRLMISYYQTATDDSKSDE